MRAYDSSLDETCTLKRRSVEDSITGETESFTTILDEDDEPVSGKVRISPISDEGSLGSQLIEVSSPVKISVQVSLPLLYPGDVIVTSAGREFKIIGSRDDRIGVTLDRKYTGERTL